MKQYQKEVERYLLQTEQKTLKQIKADYTTALEQVNQRIDELTKEHEAHPELIGKVYQRSYQEKLKKQLETALAELPEKNLEHTTTYLQQSYQDAFIGANYSTLREGYDLFLPYDTEKMIKAIYNSPAGFKISGANYEGDIRVLRKKVQSALSRGLASGMDYHSISQLAASKLNIGYNNMRRIIATEGHRVQNEAKMDCMNDAKAAGADIVKEWSAVMDSKTRPRHSVLDGQVRELDEPFTAMGADVMYPGGFGIASEDIHCRCCLLQRSRRTLSEEKTRQLKNYAAYRSQYSNTMNQLKGGHLARNGSDSNKKIVRIELGEIDTSKSEEAVAYFNESIRNEPIENCIIIQKDGKVIRFLGDIDSVEFDNVYLSGSYITHNHVVDAEHPPISFGKDDFDFLKLHQDCILHCANLDYDYSVKVLKDISELSYNQLWIEALEPQYMIDTDIQHNIFYMLDQKGYVKYERKRINTNST